MDELVVTTGKGLVATTLKATGEAANEAYAKHVFDDLDLADNTLIRYKQALERFSRFLERMTGQPCDLSEPQAWRDVTHGHLEAYKRWLFGMGYAFSTINGDVAILRKYATLAHTGGYLPLDEMLKIKAVKGFTRKARVDAKRDVTRRGRKKAETTWMTDLQALKLKEEHPDTPRGWRDRTMMALLLDYGFRASEVAAIEVENIDFEKGLLRVYRQKVDKWQTFKLSRATLATIRGFLAVAPHAGRLLRRTNNKGQLEDAPMTPVDISIRVKHLGLRVGISNLSAHDCRHFWTWKAIQNGSRQEAVQRAGGWTTPWMVQHYTKEAEIANDGVII